MPSPSEELLLDSGRAGVGFAIEGEFVAAATIEVDTVDIVDIVEKLAELGLDVELERPSVACNVKRSLFAQQASLVVGPQHQEPPIPHRTMAALSFDEFPVYHILAKSASITKMHGHTVHIDLKQSGLCQV